MTQSLVQQYFFIAVFLLVLGTAYLMLAPFVNVLLLAGVFAVVLRPAYHAAQRRLKLGPRLAALLVIAAVALVVAAAVSFLLTRVIAEANGLYETLSAGEGDYLARFVSELERLTGLILPELQFDFRAYLGTGFAWIINHLGVIFSTTASAVFKTLLGFLALFFLLKDGSRWRAILVRLSPFVDRQDDEILNRLKATINAVVRGFLLIALLQGLLTGLGLGLFGVPNATLWGSVAALAALVPGLGTALVVAPAVIYLWWQGSIGLAGLLLWGGLIVGLVDNWLGPVLYSRGLARGQGIAIHPLLMLFAVLGGLSFFGPTGFILGPLVLSLLLALTSIYERQAAV